MIGWQAFYSPESPWQAPTPGLCTAHKLFSFRYSLCEIPSNILAHSSLLIVYISAYCRSRVDGCILVSYCNLECQQNQFRNSFDSKFRTQFFLFKFHSLFSYPIPGEPLTNFHCHFASVVMRLVGRTARK